MRATGKNVFGQYASGAVPEDPMMIGVGVGHWVKPVRASIFRWLNHSCTPNIGLRDQREFVAMRSIRVGEEIVHDFSMSEADPWWSMRCLCGSRNCRRRIRAFQFLTIDQQRTYRSWVAQWILDCAALYRQLPIRQANRTLVELSAKNSLHQKNRKRSSFGIGGMY
jgi:hypothetical protein